MLEPKVKPSEMLLTGGSGRLGQELQALLPGMVAPGSSKLDITEPESVRAALKEHRPRLLIHAAAYTNVGGAEKERDACWRVNVEGTRNVARACRDAGVKLLHISTDYVFSGEEGGYREEDTPGPTANFYSLSKLAAEEAARQAEELLIVRTSFRPREFQYPVAFGDVFTSQDYVDIVAPEIALAARHALTIADEVLHIATERKSVFELARRRSPGVREGTRAEAGVQLPGDVSLDCSRWAALKEGFQASDSEDAGSAAGAR